MASDRRLLAALLPLCLGACAHDARPFAARAPFVRDTDLRSYAARCHREPSKKDPEHVACTPETYVSPLAWDGLDNAIFRPFAHVFAVDNPGQAPNANSLDEVPDSAWFTNRLGARAVDLDELSRGACKIGRAHV